MTTRQNLNGVEICGSSKAKSVVTAIGIVVLGAQAQHASAESDEMHEQNFSADSVLIEGVNNELSIETWDKDEINLRILNGHPDKPAIVASVEDNVLVIRPHPDAVTAKSVTVVSTGNGATSVVSIGGNASEVTVNGVRVTDPDAVASGAEEAVVELSLPATMDIDLLAFDGEAEIEHLEAQFRVSGNGDVEIESLHNAHVHISDNASVEVEEVSGNLSLDLVDNTEIEIENGEIDSLSLTASDNSDVIIDGTVNSAELRASNNAEVEIEKVVSQPTVQQSSNAEIIVGNWPADN